MSAVYIQKELFSQSQIAFNLFAAVHIREIQEETDNVNWQWVSWNSVLLIGVPEQILEQYTYKWSYIYRSSVIHNTQSPQMSQKQNEHNIYVIMKTICPPGYQYNGFVATHAPGHMKYGQTLLVPMNQRVVNKLRKKHNISGHK